MGTFTKEFTESNFSTDVLNSTQPVLVDFWAEWCGPCKQLGPTVDSLAEEYQGKAIVGKLNVDDHNGVASQYSIRSIPTILIFNKGEVQEKIVGNVAKDQLTSMLDKLI
tara:strand:+ start:732 stop:1058 length:327 start_codon:yes stop_codon:yes gene_type:complete